MRASISDCALDYARYWFSREHAFVAAMTSAVRSDRLAALQSAAGYFRVARTMPLAYDVDCGHERLAPALAVLEGAGFRRVTSDNLGGVVKRLRRRMGEAYGNRDLLSASTKLLWLFHRESVVIFDSQARAALGTPSGDYDAYLDRWRVEFTRTEADIRHACRALPSRFSRQVSGQEWFRMRVLDISLWRRGAQRS